MVKILFTKTIVLVTVPYTFNHVMCYKIPYLV